MNEFYEKSNIELLQNYANKVLQKKYNTTLKSYDANLLRQIITEQQNNIVTQPLIEKNKIILFHIVKKIEQMNNQTNFQSQKENTNNEREQLLMQRNYQVPENIQRPQTLQQQPDVSMQTQLHLQEETDPQQSFSYSDLISQDKPKNINFTINIDDTSFEDTENGYSNILQQRKREEEIIYKKQKHEKENNKEIKTWLKQTNTQTNNIQNNNSNNNNISSQMPNKYQILSQSIFLKIDNITNNSLLMETHQLDSVKTIQFQKIIVSNKGSKHVSLFETNYTFIKDYPYITLEIYVNNTLQQEINCFQERVCKNQVIFSNNEIITIQEGISKFEIKVFSPIHEPINVETLLHHTSNYSGTTFSKLRKKQNWDFPKFKELLTMDMKYISYDNNIYDIQIKDKVRIDSSKDLFEVKGILHISESEDVIDIHHNNKNKNNGNTILIETSEPIQENSQIYIESQTPKLYVEITKM